MKNTYELQIVNGGNTYSTAVKADDFYVAHGVYFFYNDRQSQENVISTYPVDRTIIKSIEKK